MSQAKLQVKLVTGSAGTFTAVPQYQKGTLSHWAIFNQNRGAAEVGRVTPNDFARYGDRMLNSYANGVKFEVPPPERTFAGRTQPAERVDAEVSALLRDGRDQCYRVDESTREQASAEHGQQGTFSRAVHSQPVEQWPGFERELFARLMGTAEAQEPTAGAEWLQAIHEQADLTQEWRQLEQRCRRDSWAAGIGAARTTEALAAVIEKHQGSLPTQDAETLREDAEAFEALRPGAGGSLAESAERLAGQSGALAAILRGADRELRAAFAAGAQAAQDEVTEIQAALGALGVGDAPGVASRVAAPRDEVRKALQGNPALRRIALIAGRLRMRARAAQRSKVNYVPEQVVDVTLGAELSRLLPSETVLLAEQETELLLFRKLLERQALQYRLEGREAKDRGPVILCVDNSGSMQGAPHEWAMGLALALLELCAQQKREFCLLHFDTVVRKEFSWNRADKLSWEKLVEMVTYFSNGGTAFAPVLARARGLCVPKPEADVVLLTDGAGSWEDQAQKLAEQGTKLYGVAIGSDFSAEQKAELAGAVRIANLDPGSDGPIDLVFGGL